jgi:predicted aldo/keto reductase-like oxidoreductase
VNPAEPAGKSFIDSGLREARAREMGVIGMIVLCKGLGLGLPGYGKALDWIRYALSHEVSTIVVGCDDIAQMEENVQAAKAIPLSPEERQKMEAAAFPYARQLAYYKCK